MDISKQQKKKGSVLTLTLLAVILLLFMGAGLLTLGMHSRLTAARNASEVMARCAADAGLTKALFEMNELLSSKPWDDGNLPCVENEILPHCDATFSYCITGNETNGYLIESIGKSGLAERKVSCSLAVKGPFEYAIFATKSMHFKSGTVVDGYNYSSSNEVLKIGTNSTEEGAIYARMGVTIKGDVAVGVDGDPDIVINSKNEVLITGDAYALTETYTTPIPQVPQYLVQLPSMGVIRDSVTLTGPARCEQIDIRDDDLILIDGPVILFCNGECWIDGFSAIDVVDVNTNPDAFLIMYLDGTFTLNNGTVNNTTKDPAKVKIYGLENCYPVSLGSNFSAFYGAIYAPAANATTRNSFTFKGAIICKQFAQQIGSNFFYDASLKNLTVNDEMTRFVVQNWHEW